MFKKSNFFLNVSNQILFIYNSMKSLSLCLILGLVVGSLAADCGPGGVESRNGTCIFPSFIEGCYTYASSSSCQECQYNYAKEGNICGYMPPSDNSNCCKAFIQPSGECSECAPGLSLFDGKCIDKKIVGCLVKSKTGSCLNCALSYTLLGGQCIKKTQGCKKYSPTGVCESCDVNFNLARGYCIPKKAIIRQETCRSPWLKGPSGDCEIAGCELYYDFGCSKCKTKFRLLPDNSCKEGQIEGCDIYAPDGYCQACKKPVYTEYSGFCIPFGCTRLTPEGKCNQCNSKFGFEMSIDGYCRIPNCLVSNDKQCLVCEKGFVQTYIGCQREDPRKICVTCARGFYLTESLDCQPKEPGCVSYSRYKCDQCEANLYLDKDYKCVEKQPGCVYEKGYCTSCSFPFKKKNLKCTIEGCSSFSETGCKSCLAPYILSKFNTCTFQNCIEVSDGRCLKCEQGFSTSHDGFCYKVDPFCKAYSFSGECIQCKLGYYFEKSTTGVKVCREEKYGCNYVDGRCVSCRAPFDYQPQEQACVIDGCLKYFLGGCSICAAGYDLRYNTCKLPFCLISHKGHCAECDPNYVLKSDGTCVNKDQFCWKYDKDGNCIECSPEYFLSKITKKCKPRQPGCLYNDGDRCYACEKPFYFDGVRCSIYGCMKHKLKGCDKCYYPMEPTKNGLCSVINCDRMQEDKCKACKPGYMLIGDGSCRQEDPKCEVYGQLGCKTCVKGYAVDRSGICEYRDEHCWTFTEQGYCANCDKLYFLNTLKKCELKDSNCEAYSGGRCVKCKSYYYLFKGMCVPNSQGCIKQKNIRKCDQCQTGYEIVQGTCEIIIKKPTYDDIDMGFFDDETDDRKQQSKQVFTTGKTNKKNLIASILKGNAKIIYSSVIEGRSSFQVDDTSDANGWTPMTNGNQFVGVLLSEMQIMYAVDIKYLNGNTLKRFAIEQSDDGANWVRVQQFTIGQSTPDSVQTFYFTPVHSLAIRIVVLEGTPNIKFEFYYGSGNYDSQSSSSSRTYIEQQTELTIDEQVNTEQFSVQEGCVDKELCWMGIQLCEAKPIIGFTLEPLKESKGTIDNVSVKYSTDGVKFECYNECKEIGLVNNSVLLNPRVTAMKLRVYPEKWNGQPKYSVTFEY